MNSHYFELFGFPVEHALDRGALESRYLELAKEFHPDRYAGGTLAEQRASMEQSSQLNEGYRILRDPTRRAEYIVKLAGIDLDSSDSETGAPAMDQRFLIEMIERREALGAARLKGEAAAEEQRQRVEAEADEVFERAVHKLQVREVLAAARLLVERRYLQRLLDELDDITPTS